MTMFGYNVLGFGSGGPPPNTATGGTITRSGAFTIHVFNSSGTFTPVSPSTLTVEYLVVAGGGGGSSGGGGGAGGYRSSVSGESSGGGASAESALEVSGATTVTVGGDRKSVV